MNQQYLNHRKVTETFALKLKNKLKEIDEGKTLNQSWSTASCSGTAKSKQLKSTRKIHLNWICDHKQVRRNQGGGVREIDVPKSFKKKEILNEAVKIYFPNENSKCKGPISNYTFDLLDFSNNSFDENLTVEQIYELTRLTRLRFCLNTITTNNSASKSGHNKKGHAADKKRKQRLNRKVTCDSKSSSLGKSDDDEPKKCIGKKTKKRKASKYNLDSSTSGNSGQEENCVENSPRNITEKNIVGDGSLRRHNDLCFNSKPEYNDYVSDNSFDMDQFLNLHTDINSTSPNQCIDIVTTPIEEVFFEGQVFHISNIADTTSNLLAENSGMTNWPSQITNPKPAQSSPNSQDECLNTMGKKLDFQSELKLLQDKIVYGADPVLINACRGGTVGSIRNAMKRSPFSFLKRLDVVFVDVCETSEGAVDEGGPTRELFRLALHELKESKIFSGHEDGKNIVYNVTSLQKEEYSLAGKIVAMSIIHGGPRPTFLSETLFSRIAYNSANPTMDNIVGSEAYQEVLALSKADNGIDFKTVISSGDLLLELGIEPTVQFEKKNSIMEEILRHLVIDRPHKAIEEFIEGLNIFDLVSIIRKYPDEAKSLFCNAVNKPMTSQYIKQLFVIERSSEGTQRRLLENKIIALWMDYLQNCEDGDCDVKVEDILSFTTGAHREPALGFPEKPTIKFLHEDNSIFPKSNTCNLILYLPVKSTDYDEFVRNMDFGIVNGLPTFGLS